MAGSRAKEWQKFPPFELVDGGWNEQPDSRTMERCGWAFTNFGARFAWRDHPSSHCTTIARLHSRVVRNLWSPARPAIQMETTPTIAFDIRGRVNIQDIKYDILQGIGGIGKMRRSVGVRPQKIERYKTGPFGKRNAVWQDVENSTRRKGLQGALGVSL